VKWGLIFNTKLEVAQSRK